MRYASIRSALHTCRSCDGFRAGIGVGGLKGGADGHRPHHALVRTGTNCNSRASRAASEGLLFVGNFPCKAKRECFGFNHRHGPRAMRQAFSRGDVCRQLHSQRCPGCHPSGSELLSHSEKSRHATRTCVHSMMCRYIEEARECAARFLL